MNIMSDFILYLFKYPNILSWYTYVKHFPENSILITNPRISTSPLKGKIDGKSLWRHALGYGILFTVLSIMIIASVINYEVMFRPKARNATNDGGGDVNYYDEYYKIEENVTGRYFYVPLLSIVVLILIVGWLYYIKPELFN